MESPTTTTAIYLALLVVHLAETEKRTVRFEQLSRMGSSHLENAEANLAKWPDQA